MLKKYLTEEMDKKLRYEWEERHSDMQRKDQRLPLPHLGSTLHCQEGRVDLGSVRAFL